MLPSPSPSASRSPQPVYRHPRLLLALAVALAVVAGAFLASTRQETPLSDDPATTAPASADAADPGGSLPPFPSGSTPPIPPPQSPPRAEDEATGAGGQPEGGSDTTTDPSPPPEPSSDPAEHPPGSVEERLTFGPVEFQIKDPDTCLGDNPALRMSGSVTLSGPVARTEPIDIEYRPDNDTATVFTRYATDIVATDKPLTVQIRLELGDLSFSLSSRASTDTTYARLVDAEADCAGYLAFPVQFKEFSDDQDR